MIKFKGKDTKLEEYVEMGISFSQGTGKRDQFESFEDFQIELRNLRHSGDHFTIKSSSNCDYDNQEKVWKELALKCNYDGVKEMANAIAKLMNDKDTFAGLEGLAAMSGNKELMEMSDYAFVGDGDQLITSMFYGGSRMKQWKRYAKPYITPSTFINELGNFEESNNSHMHGLQIEIINKNSVKITFENEDAKKLFHTALENGDDLFDFSIAEDYESMTWTIMVK